MDDKKEQQSSHKREEATEKKRNIENDGIATGVEKSAQRLLATI